ncbi:DNA polymerase epsilon subunit 4-like [Argonauta hians]
MKENDEQENKTEDNEQMEANGVSSDKLVKLPISRIRKIIKLDPDVSLASQEAMIVLSKATELFVQYVSREASNYTFQGKRKTLQRKDLDVAVERTDTLAFLDGALE